MIESNESHFFEWFIVEAFYAVVIHIELIRPLDPNWPIKLSKGGKKQLVTFKKV